MRVVRRGVIESVGPEGLTLDADLLPWNVEARVSDDGRAHYQETWEPGSLVAEAPIIPVFDGHLPTPRGIEHGPLIGRAYPVDSTDTAFRARIELADIPRARDVHALADLVGATVSIEADTPAPPAGWDGRRLVRTAKDPAWLIGVAIELLPNTGAIPGAVVTAARARTEGVAMPTAQLSPTDPETPDPPDPETPDPPETVGRADVQEMIRSAVARVNVGVRTGSPHPLARFDSFADAIIAGTTDVDIARALGRMMVARALADQVTTDPNTGVMHQGWINQIYGIVDQGRPVINAIGPAELPAEGMTINWPVFSGDLMTLVGKQVGEKTGITSVKVPIGNANAPLETFAGGSDISLQLIRRSSPSYLEAYLRIMAAAYAAVTDKAASDGLTAQVTAGRGNYVIYDPAAADPTGEVLRTAVFTASVKVATATGSPATVALAGATAFIKLGGKLSPPPVFNASGTAQASTLDVVVSGLRVVYAPYLGTNEIIVTNTMAAAWREDGPQTINALDVEKLGQNYAVWGMALLTPTIPKGIVGLRTVAPALAEGETEAADPGFGTTAPKSK